MATLEEVFEQFKKLPDWDRFPMPQVFYDYFSVKKPQPSASLMETLAYTPPPHQSLNTNGKVEIRKPVDGGVREITDFLTLPVEQTLITDETDSCMLTDSEQTTSNPPTEDSKTETQPVLGHQSPDLSCAVPDTSPVALCHDVVCSPELTSPRSESS